MAGIRILFVQDNGINESLALTELSAFLQVRGHQTHLLLARQEGRTLDRKAAGFEPHLVVLPCNVFGHRFVLDTADRLRRVLPGVPILVGGTHPTFSPSVLEHPAVDWILVGEAELAVASLADRLACGKGPEGIPGIWWKEGGKVVSTGPAALLESLDELPAADRGLYLRYGFMRRFPWKKFSTGRGCVNRCSFCYNNRVRSLYRGAAGNVVRRKPVERVFQEIEDVARQSRLDWVHFSDDLFVTDPQWLERFCVEYPRGFSLPFSCNSSGDRMTREAATLLGRAGCRVVAIGVETASEERRVRWLGKPVTNAVLESAAQHVHAAGMKLVTFNMIGLPGETLEDAIATIRYSRRLGAEAVRVTMAVPLPGTRMALEATDAGQLDQRLAHDFSAQIDLAERPYGPYYDLPDAAGIEALLNLAPLVRRLPTGAGLARMLRLVPRAATRPARCWMALQERGIYGFPFAAGLDFFLHVGNPWMRTTNYVALI